MALRPRDFKSLASTSFAIRAALEAYAMHARLQVDGPPPRIASHGTRKTKAPPERGFGLEAEVGIEPAYADLQSAA
jgi:hypothetical protein